MAEGWHGWDEYAAFYDWENARTVGRRDVTFWRGLAARAKGRVLELGCGTGRVLVPVARDGRRIVGIDRSTPMLDRARAKLARARAAAGAGGAAPARGAAARRHPRPAVARGDVRPGHGAVRHPAVVDPRGRPPPDPGGGPPRAPPGRPVRHRPRARRAALERIRAPADAQGLRADRPANPARRNRPPGSQAAADHLRPGVHRRTRAGRRPAGASRCRSAPSICRRCGVGSSGPASRCRPSSATTTGARGTTAPTRG